MTPQRKTKILVALDTQDIKQARQWREEVRPYVDGVKLGLEFVCANGFDALREVAGDLPYFLDLKLHDIPNTVASAIKALAPHKPAMLTVHTTGGEAMLKAARRACDEAFPEGHRPLLLGVTVLTALSDRDLQMLGSSENVASLVLRLGQLAKHCGLDGLICSGHDLTALRSHLGDDMVLVTPGIRPQGSDKGDQKRVMTPHQASIAGADWIVVGRPITKASSPAGAAKMIASQL